MLTTVSDPTAVFAPFGLANPGHDCTHDAALLAAPGVGTVE
jgi:hypothetical protein